MVVIGQKWFYSGKGCCVRAKVVVFGQKWLCSGKSGCIRARVAVFFQNGFIWAKVFVFGLNFLFLLSCCIRATVVVFG